MTAKPAVSKVATRQLDALETRLCLELPYSVREWYSHFNAIETLAVCSNDDHPIPIQEFELEQWKSHTFLPFKIENQGVCRWAISLDGSVDPPIFVNVEEAGWIAHADTFSRHVYSCVWDHATVFAKPGLVQAQNVPISSSTLNNLATHFTAEIRTFGWPGQTQYRFAGDRQTILIWSNEHQADWFVAADDTDTLHSLLELIWPLDAVGAALYGCSEMGCMALKLIISERVSKEARL
ncbi:MAG: hypothetical protein AAF268_09815 [Cyanobacteria bacterium P01_A01_bin.3]